MDTFGTTLNIICPTFLLIALGYVLRLWDVLDEHSCQKISGLGFRVLIPSMVFYSIYNADLRQMTNPTLLLFCFLGVTGVFLLLLLVVPLLEKDRAKTGVIIQGAFRSTFVVLGMGLAGNMYPGANLGVVAITGALAAIMFNAYSVVALALFSGESVSAGGIAKSLVTNPLIIASALAITFLAAGVRLPTLAETFIGSLSSIATTVSLLGLGGTLSFAGIEDARFALAFTCILKVAVLPLIFVPLAVWMGFQGMELLTILILFGSSGSVTGHVMAVQAKSNGDLAGQIVVLTTCLSTFTLFGFIYVLIALGFL